MVIGASGGPEDARGVDPAAALREEQEAAAAWVKADAQDTVSVQMEAQATEAATKARAEVDAKAVENPVGSRIPDVASLE